MRHKVHVLQMQLLRRDARWNTMTDVIQNLKENGTSTQSVEEVLRNRFSGFSLDVLDNEMQNSSIPKNRKHYSEEIKSFALTLYFYSQKAYHFVAGKLNLPHDSMLRKCLSTSNCEPGFSSEMIAFLQEHVKTNEYLKDVALIFDAMSIRSEIVYDKKSDIYRGYIDYGGIAHVDSNEIATEVLVLQIVSYSRKFKIPIAFFFTNKTITDLQYQIVHQAIIILQETGITVRSITCDGCATNIKTKFVGMEITNAGHGNIFQTSYNGFHNLLCFRCMPHA